VKAAARKVSPCTRSWASAWDEISITTVSVPASTICRNSFCSASASGVVCEGVCSRPANLYWMVPMRPVDAPPAAQIDSSR
jgi:hypothetical protein